MYDNSLRYDGQETGSVSSPSSKPVFVLPEKVVPTIDLSQSVTKRFSRSLSRDDMENCDILQELEDLTRRTSVLAQVLASVPCDEQTLVWKACLTSLHTQLPHMLRQTKELVEYFEQLGVDRVVLGKLRCKNSLIRAIKFLHNIEIAYKIQTLNTDGPYCNTLTSIRDKLRNISNFHPQVRVSPWVSTCLAFEVSVGNPVRHCVTGMKNDDLPLTMKIEPFVEFVAHDESSKKAAIEAAVPCQVSVVKCAHRNATSESRAGVGIVGKASVTIRLSPYKENDGQLKVRGVAKDRKIIWGSGKPATDLCLREVRVIQLNAFPPKPSINVDLYTSYEYGDPSVCLTLILPTYETRSEETPDLHFELILSPPKL